jgi:fatty-acyl-CoA synthase
MSGSDRAISLSELPSSPKHPPPVQVRSPGSHGPVAMGKALKSIVQWSFTPAGLLALGAAQDPYHTAVIDDAGSIT